MVATGNDVPCPAISIVRGKAAAHGGVFFSRGALFHLLKNRIYLGEIIHRDKVYPGLHPALVDRALFDTV